MGEVGFGFSLQRAVWVRQRGRSGGGVDSFGGTGLNRRWRRGLGRGRGGWARDGGAAAKGMMMEGLRWVLRGRGSHRLWFCLVRLKKLPWFEVGFTAEAVWWINYGDLMVVIAMVIWKLGWASRTRARDWAETDLWWWMRKDCEWSHGVE
ncbi:hypothetical protein M0R45_008601 [Rubus argutus]|uniref:Uncharacterized protein n=1 Tax=Rubus argutus TaxID=59490 RepID=A0AAW1Y253_RUBAR